MSISHLPIPYDLTPPPPQPLGVRLRRLFRSRKALSGVTQWFIDWGIPLAILLGVLYFYAARSKSYSDVYKTFTLIDPPNHVLLWIASLIGWLLVPAIIGGIAGHVIATRIQSVKQLSTSGLFRRRRLGEILRPPSQIAYLGAYFNKAPEAHTFLDNFVRRAHRNHWLLAQDHWEVLVRDTMCTAEYAELGRNECLRQAQDMNNIHLRVAATAGQCVVCAARRS
ncbi:DUF6313 family protein [Streptomyces sp. NBC_01217]|uniref:DUF6313 family protein n=1 Tax=Streptomyces sp. NBC_01217 TaxID=2903779 RepID=UPI002E142186|nr:DUF6313 family protein [Streptomyces sp. NBC_01217]